MADYRRGQRDNNSTLWLILGLVGGGVLLLVLLCGGAIYMITSAFRSGAQAISKTGQEFVKLGNEIRKEQEAAQQAQRTARVFLEDCLAGHVNAAYALTSAAFRKDLTPAQFKELLDRHPTGKAGPLNPALVQQGVGPSQYRYTTTGPAGGQIVFTVTLVQEGNAWKVDQLTIDDPAGK